MSAEILNALSTMAPMLVLFLGAIALMLADAFAGEDAHLAIPTAVFFGATIFFALRMPEVVAPPAIARFIATDDMAVFFDVVICAGGAFSALLAGGYMKEHGLDRGELYVLLVLSALGAMILARATDLLTVFLGLETMSLGVYAMVGFRRTSARAAEAAIKYFLLGSFAAAILLFGSAMLYGATGHTDLVGIGQAIREGHADLRLTLLGMCLVLVGLAFKVGAVPFHMWTPDAYDGAITPATTFMAVVVKAAAFAALARVLVSSFGDELSRSLETGWPPLLGTIAAVTMVVGNIAAIGQTSVKRMLAYSSIAHAGYILVGIAAAAKVGASAFSGVFFYLAAYTASNALAFGSLIFVGSRGKEAVTYEDLAGVGRRHPAVAIPFIAGILSLMGMPPTAGFFGKYYVFSAAVEAGGPLLWLAVLGVITSAIGAYYYLRVLVFMFMRDPAPGAPVAVPMRSAYVVAALALSGYFVFEMGIAPSPFLRLASEAAAKLFA